MMGLRGDFEPTRAVHLNRFPLPSLDVAVKELISEENQHPHHRLPSSDVVLATPRPSISLLLINLVVITSFVKS
jgi:hypothetical protein